MPGYQQILRACAKGSNKQVIELLSVEQKLEMSAYEAFKKEVLKYAHYPIYFNNIPRDMEFVKESNIDVTNKYPDHNILGEEFENIDATKYVHLDRVYKMLCVYNKKYCRWCPIKIETKRKMTHLKRILQMEKK